MLLILHIITYLSIAALTSAQFQPSEVPLLVRSPYFSSWVSRNISDDSPKFWNGNNVRQIVTYDQDDLELIYYADYFGWFY
jgi:hypothetical protein